MMMVLIAMTCLQYFSFFIISKMKSLLNTKGEMYTVLTNITSYRAPNSEVSAVLPTELWQCGRLSGASWGFARPSRWLSESDSTIHR